MNTPYIIPEENRVRVIFDIDSSDETILFTFAHCLLSPEFLLCGVSVSGNLTDKVADFAKSTEAKLKIENNLDFAVEEAMKDDNRLLYLVCLGSLKNVSELLNRNPQIMDKIKVLWTGGGASSEGVIETNYAASPSAAEELMESGTEMYVIPMKTYQKVRVTLSQLQLRLGNCGKIGKYLFDMLCHINENDKEGRFQGEAWILPGEAAVSVLLCPEQRTWTLQTPMYGSRTGRPIRVYDNIDNRMVLEDMFAKLRLNFDIRGEQYDT